MEVPLSAHDSLPVGAVARLGTPRFAWGWGICGLAWSPDGATLAAAGVRHVVLFDARDGHVVRVFEGHRAYERPQITQAVAFASDGHLVSFGGDNHCRRWNPSTGACDAVDIHAEIGSLSPDGRYVYAQRKDTYRGTVHDLATGRALREITPRSDSTGHLSAWSPAGDVLATATTYGDAVTLWHPETGERLDTLASPGAEFYELRFSPDGVWLAASSNLGPVALWSVATRARCFTTEALQRGGALYACPALSSRGVLAVAAKGRVDLYDVASGRRLTTWTVHTWGGALAFSPDGLALAYAAQGCVRLFDVAAMQERAREGHHGTVGSLGVSRDGRRVVTAAFDTA